MAKKKKPTMEIVTRKISELNRADYNPRKLSNKKKREIQESLETFGMVDPIIVNKHPDRMDVIVGGHQRSAIWEQMGNFEIPTVEVNLDYDAEKELNLRLNKNSGEFDYEKVVELFDVDKLMDIGFSTSELPDMLSDFEEKFEDLDVDEPKYLIVPKFNEAYNMVMIFCESELDFTWLKNVLGIERKKCYKSSKVADSLVITAKEFQKKWQENEDS